MPSKVVSGVGSTSVILREGRGRQIAARAALRKERAGWRATKCEKLLPLPDDIPKTSIAGSPEIEHAIPYRKAGSCANTRMSMATSFGTTQTKAERNNPRPRELQPGCGKHNEDKTECWYEHEETNGEEV